MRHYFSIVIFIIVGCFTPYAFAQNPDPNEDNPVVIDTAENDMEMEKARQKAMSSIQDYWIAKENCEDCHTFKIKVAFGAPNGALEHMWVDSAQETDGMIVGILENEPRDVKALAIGDKVTFTNADISDWSYFKGQKAEGHFTTRVLLRRMPAEQKYYYADILGWTEGSDY